MKITPTHNGWKVEIEELSSGSNALPLRRFLYVARGENFILDNNLFFFRTDECGLVNCHPEGNFLKHARETLDNILKITHDQHLKAKIGKIKVLMHAKKNDETPAKREESEGMMNAFTKWEKEMTSLESHVNGLKTGSQTR